MAAKVENPEIIARNIQEWKIPVPDKNYKVVIHCSTYNHEKYIKDALKGFVMQETNFPFCAIIIDDCSTDRNADIIRMYAKEYPDIIKPICLGYNHMQHGLSRNPYFDCWHESCEYLAQCEGDDYWTDPLKLQKQVDYLDCNPDCGMVYTKVEKYIQSKNAVEGTWGKKCSHLDLLLGASPVPTLTVCYREDSAKIYYDSIKNDPKWRLGDVPLWLYFIKYSSVHFIDEITGVYRELNESASHSLDFNKRSSFINSAFDCRAFYAERYWGKSIAKKVKETKLFNLINTSFEFDEKLNINFISDIRKYKIFNIRLYILYIFSCIKGIRHYYHNRIFKNKR